MEGQEDLVLRVSRIISDYDDNPDWAQAAIRERAAKVIELVRESASVPVEEPEEERETCCGRPGQPGYPENDPLNGPWECDGCADCAPEIKVGQVWRQTGDRRLRRTVVEIADGRVTFNSLPDQWQIVYVWDLDEGEFREKYELIDPPAPSLNPEGLLEGAVWQRGAVKIKPDVRCHGYIGGACPECNRVRLELYVDGTLRERAVGIRCEKCHAQWLLDPSKADFYSDYADDNPLDPVEEGER